MKDIDYFTANPDEFAALSEAEQAALLNGDLPAGETTEIRVDETPENPETPEAPKPDDAEKADDEQSGTPEVLAKDGKHTIPFAELEAARAEAAEARRLADEYAQKLAEIEAAKLPPPPTPAEIADLRAKLRDAYDLNDWEAAEKLQGELDAKLDQVADAKAEAKAREILEAKAAEEAQAAEAKAAEEAQAAAERAFADTVAATVKQYPFLDSTSPQANPVAINLVVARRDALFAQGMPAHEALAKAAAEIGQMIQPAAAPTKTAAEIAAEAAAKAKPKPPTSLSSVANAGSAQHDEAEAVADMTPEQRIDYFMGKSPEKIMEFLRKVT